MATRRRGEGWSRRRILSLGAGGASAIIVGVPLRVGAERPPMRAEQPLPEAAAARQRARLRLMRVALGQEPADTVIVNGTLLNSSPASCGRVGAWP